jgi:hypothetical protein
MRASSFAPGPVANPKIYIVIARRRASNGERAALALLSGCHSDFSKTTQSFYWMNHCEHCGMKQRDFELFEESNTPFCPISPKDASRILLRSVSEAFEASGHRLPMNPDSSNG